MGILIAVLLSAIGALLIDSIVIPRHALVRSGKGAWLQVFMALTMFGLFLAIGGSPLLAAFVTLGLNLLTAVVSNAKQRMLGEPLHFSDLALVRAVFRHPQFYFSALAGWQKIVGIIALAVALGGFFLVFDPALSSHLVGAAIAALSFGTLIASLQWGPFRLLAREPRAEDDVRTLGLLPTLLLYSIRWRASEDPPNTVNARRRTEPAPDGRPIIVAIQCESFADPAELFGESSFALPGLENARATALQWGNLMVSGFGAYTMRTEYGVLFGREEEDLGFRRYDPFLTAEREPGHALPHKLLSRNWRSIFVHPHDMRFYNRHRILPASGFEELVSENHFSPPAAGQGRYVADRAVAEKVLQIAVAASRPSFIYAVTMENHGPWSAKGEKSDSGLMRNYNRLAQAGDAMLCQLKHGLASMERPSLLVFFGDHRPSIPGVSDPGGDRHTPYVILRFDAKGRIITGANRRADITPAKLHHAILDEARTF